MPVLTQLLVTAGDEEVLVDACWAISYLVCPRIYSSDTVRSNKDPSKISTAP